MVFHQHIPAYPLNRFIESFIYYKDYNPTHSFDRFLPDGNVNIVIDLTDYPKGIYDNESFREIQSCRNVWFSGIRNTYITIPSGKDSEMFIINFHKGRAYPFAGMPMDELTDNVVDGEWLMTREVMNMRDALLEADSVTQKFTSAENFLLKKFGSRLSENPYVDFAVNRILHMPHQTSIEYLSSKVGYSQKHLVSIFRKHVGITPKSFLRIIRFQRAIREIEAGRRADWTGIALDSGYYDQAHFINDFRAFSGFTPAQFQQSQSAFTNYVAVG